MLLALPAKPKSERTLALSLKYRKLWKYNIQLGWLNKEISRSSVGSKITTERWERWNRHQVIGIVYLNLARILHGCLVDWSNQFPQNTLYYRFMKYKYSGWWPLGVSWRWLKIRFEHHKTLQRQRLAIFWLDQKFGWKIRPYIIMWEESRFIGKEPLAGWKSCSYTACWCLCFWRWEKIG